MARWRFVFPFVLFFDRIFLSREHLLKEGAKDLMERQPNIRDTVYKSILDSIVSLEFQPGDILNEKALVEKYHCSKSPVREALLTLCTEGVLRSIPRYGYEIVRLTRDDIYEMIQFRYLLESGMLQISYQSLQPGQLARLEQINRQCQDCSADVWEHWRYNTDFHLTLIGFCGNCYVRDALSRCMDRLRRAYAQCYWNKWDNTIPPMDTRNHRLILDALAQRNLQALLRALAVDLNDFGSLAMTLL